MFCGPETVDVTRGEAEYSQTCNIKSAFLTLRYSRASKTRR